MTERLGDARSVEMVRAHDALVRRALKDKGGHVVKHTGDGIMASFADAAASVQCARAIQQAFEAFNLASKEKLQVQNGIDVGEPIADSNDLFGATVQLAARLCQLAEPDAILVSSAVQDRIRDRLHVTNIGPCHLKASCSLLMYTDRMALAVATADDVSNEATTSAVGGSSIPAIHGCQVSDVHSADRIPRGSFTSV